MPGIGFTDPRGSEDTWHTLPIGNAAFHPGTLPENPPREEERLSPKGSRAALTYESDTSMPSSGNAGHILNFFLLDSHAQSPAAVSH